MKDIKALDPKLIQRANDSSIAFDFGNTISKKYENNIAEINKMGHLDDQAKEKVIDNLYKLHTIELAAQGKAINPYTYGYGPAVINKERDINNLDASTITRVNANNYMNKIREDKKKAIKLQKHKELAEAIKETDENGLKEITIGEKTYYKIRKYWSNTKPKQLKR